MRAKWKCVLVLLHYIFRTLRIRIKIDFTVKIRKRSSTHERRNRAGPVPGAPGPGSGDSEPRGDEAAAAEDVSPYKIEFQCHNSADVKIIEARGDRSPALRAQRGPRGRYREGEGRGRGRGSARASRGSVRGRSARRTCVASVVSCRVVSQSTTCRVVPQWVLCVCGDASEPPLNGCAATRAPTLIHCVSLGVALVLRAGSRADRPRRERAPRKLSSGLRPEIRAPTFKVWNSSGTLGEVSARFLRVWVKSERVVLHEVAIKSRISRRV